ncbi:MAG: ribosome small subunit-dependent GTPase A [Pirellulales bacterium]|nr:ribosome small subunit-dependent GTPase A [Pirellulales bacterium]
MARKKFRAEFRKNRGSRQRENDLTRDFQADRHNEDHTRDERISGKGELTRKRTIIGDVAADDAGLTAQPGIDLSVCRRGRVLSVFGLTSLVEDETGAHYQCATRRLLKTLATDQRHVVAAGDYVYFRPAAEQEGIIERVERRHGVLSRMSKGRRHIMVTNVDQLLVIGSAAEPYLKPNLIDRFLVSAEQAGLRPIIGINKVDLADPADLQPLVGVYARMGYRVLLLSARQNMGIARLRQWLGGYSTVIVGQSGVGKSSLLNAVQPDWNLRTSHVSADNQKGRHTTTTAKLLKLDSGGYVVDTPGIRQFQLWDIIPEEVAGHFRDLRPYANLCKYPNCTHTHEAHCAVKDGVADGFLDARRYESYCALVENNEPFADWD